jgi:NADPH:quinone reductase-like Zn-dependent oxidoreductase
MRAATVHRVKAAVNSRYGPPEVVRIAEVMTPEPGPGEVLVRVHASTVNRTDCGFRAGKPWIVRFFSGLARPKASILGCEFAGEIATFGDGVSSFAVGDRVFGFSEDRFGAHAEYLTFPAGGPIATIPVGMPFEEIVPSTEGSHYALAPITKLNIGSGKDVLLNGGTGAIGSAAIQLLKDRGANVTAVVDTDHLELVRDLGADRVIDRNVEDFTRDPHTYDVVFDAVGKSSFRRCKRLLRPKGIYLSTDLGPLSMNPVLALTTPLFGGRRVRFPIPPKHTKQEIEGIRSMIVAGTFRPVVDRRYPLEEIVEAYRYVETGQKIGNVVITIADA